MKRKILTKFRSFACAYFDKVYENVGGEGEFESKCKSLTATCGNHGNVVY